MGRDTIHRAKQGDREAFSLLVVEHSDRLFSVAYRILRDRHRADDAVQQALLTSWREIPRLRDEDRFEAWLYRLLVHACYAEVRHVQRWQPGLRLIGTADGAVEDAQSSVARRDELERAFRQLPVEHRTILVLHDYLGLSGAEVADVLNLAPGTVRSRLHRGRQRMRAAIEADARVVAHGGTA